MSNDNCSSCGTPQSNPTRHLLVEATASEVSTCGQTPSGTNPSCAKKDQTFDSFLNGFVIPLAGNQVTVNVCNGALYVQGQWIQTVVPVAYFKILSVAGNYLTLVNQCPGGFVVPENPIAGQAISPGTNFYVVAEPECLSAEERASLLNSALEAATQLCTPSMVESSDTAWVQPVGRVEADPGDTSFQKCIKRIRGIIFKAGIPFLNLLKNNINSSAVGIYKRVGIDKATKEIVELPNYGDFTGTVVGEQYAVAAYSAGDKVVGPAAFFCPVEKLLAENGALTSTASWTVFNTDLTVNLNMNVAEINDILKHKDHYHANVHVIFCISESISGGAVFKLEMNGELASVFSEYGGSAGLARSRWYSLCIPVKVLLSSNTIAMKFTHIDAGWGGVGTNVRVYYKASLKGIFA